MKALKFLAALGLLSAILVSCKKKEVTPDDPPEPVYGSLTLQFENKFGSKDLVLFTDLYTNNTDTFNVTTFNYYVSNIQLTATDGSVYSETDSYHLVKAEEPSSLQFTLSKIPEKNFLSITFMIGVDSLHNVSGAQTGALDPVNGHFWSWSSGYIMTKFEGTSPQSTALANMVLFHVGGFSGVNSTLKTVTLPFTANADVSASKTPKVFIKADLAEWFSPNAVSFGTLHTIHMPGANAKKIADNYANMFSVTQVVN